MEQPHHQQTCDVAHGAHHQQPEQLPSVMPNSGKGKGKRTRNWDEKETSGKKRERDWQEAETSALLQCVNLPQFRQQKRKQIYMKWDAIADEIMKRLGSTDALLTAKRCRERMKTLRSYYQVTKSELEKMKKNKEGLTEDERCKLIQSCGLMVTGWYEAIEEEVNRGPRQGKGRSRVQRDLGRNVTTDRPSSSRIPTVSGSSEAVQTESPDAGRPAYKQIASRGFNSLNDSQGSTLLDLIFSADIFGKRPLCDRFPDYKPLSNLCGWLSIVQNRRCSAVYDDVIALEKMGLVSTSLRSGCVFYCVGECELSDHAECELSDHAECARSDGDGEVILKLHIKYSHFCGLYKKFFKKVMLRNPAYDTRRRMENKLMVELNVMSAPHRITVLNLHGCEKLEMVDLSGFGKLRALSILKCPKLSVMMGWECLEELGWVEIGDCPLYVTYPPFQKTPSLQESYLYRGYGFSTSHDLVPRELNISACVRLRTLLIEEDYTLSSICGLEGLRSLTLLSLCGCHALENLPDIGHMQDLTHLDICDTPIGEIKGIEKLSSLKLLVCALVTLKTLPDLSHLPHMQFIDLTGSEVLDPLSPYFGDYDVLDPRVEINSVNKHVNVSDISDIE